MSWQFWLIPLVIFWSFGFRRRFNRPDRIGKRHRREAPVPARDPELLTELETQRDYIGGLEARVAERAPLRPRVSHHPFTRSQTSTISMPPSTT